MGQISPEAFERMVREGQAYIDKLKATLEYDELGILVLPATCYGCAKKKVNIVMMTGDGLPMCGDCFHGFENILKGESEPKA